MTEGILIAIIPALGALLGLVIKIMYDSHKTRSQVENTHTQNLRDDIDAKHQESMTAIRHLAEELRDQRKDIGGMRADIRQIRGEVSDIQSRDHEADRIHRTLGDRVAALAARMGSAA